jgi:hypothetical protein
MEDTSFEELIQELQALRIRETAIIVQLERVNNAAKRGNNHIPEQESAAKGLQKGDRVRITKK